MNKINFSHNSRSASSSPVSPTFRNVRHDTASVLKEVVTAGTETERAPETKTFEKQWKRSTHQARQASKKVGSRRL